MMKQIIGRIDRKSNKIKSHNPNIEVNFVNFSKERKKYYNKNFQLANIYPHNDYFKKISRQIFISQFIKDLKSKNIPFIYLE